MRLAICFVLVAAFLMGGCASNKELRAPCDENATFCGSKTKINNW